MSDREDVVALADRIDTLREYGTSAILNPDNAKMVVKALRSAARTGPDVAGFEVCLEARRLVAILAFTMQTALTALKETSRSKEILDTAQDSLQQALKLEADFADKELKAAIAALPAPANDEMRSLTEEEDKHLMQALIDSGTTIEEIFSAPASATASAGWRTMGSAPKDGRSIAVIQWWPSYTGSPGKWGRVEIYSYEQDPQREQCWIDVHRSSCIREDQWTERYRWAPLPVDLPPAPTKRSAT